MTMTTGTKATDEQFTHEVTAACDMYVQQSPSFLLLLLFSDIRMSTHHMASCVHPACCHLLPF